MKLGIAAMALLATAAASPVPAGTWHQTSDGTEIVIESKIKLTPSGNFGGTSLGGSAGYGSMTTTRIVVEPTPKRVARSMALTISNDGRFDWAITRRFPDANGCTRTVRQGKKGTVSMTGGTIAFAVQGGEERFEGCGSDATKTIVAGVERYSVAMAGSTMTLAGTGDVRWQFRK